MERVLQMAQTLKASSKIYRTQFSKSRYTLQCLTASHLDSFCVLYAPFAMQDLSPTTKIFEDAVWLLHRVGWFLSCADATPLPTAQKCQLLERLLAELHSNQLICTHLKPTNHKLVHLVEQLRAFGQVQSLGCWQV